jgi:hypothetical protein
MKFSLKMISKKGAVFGVSAGVALGLTGAALAYWTSTGSGTGAATNGSSTNLVITQVGTTTALTPSGPAQQVNYSVNNPGTGNEQLGQVTISITTISNVLCLASWYHIVQPPVTNAEVLGGATNQYNPSGATIQLVDQSAVNQDACQGATVNLAFTSN